MLMMLLLMMEEMMIMATVVPSRFIKGECSNEGDFSDCKRDADGHKYYDGNDLLVFIRLLVSYSYTPKVAEMCTYLLLFTLLTKFE